MENNDNWIEIDSVPKAVEWFERDKKFESKYRECIRGKEKFKDCGFTDYYKQGIGRQDFPKNLEPDSSPKAWEHYIRHYTTETFGETLDKYVDSGSNFYLHQKYLFERLKYYVSRGIPRVFAVPEICAKNQAKRATIKDETGNKILPERLGGDCDFNFNDIKCKNFKKLLKNDQEELLNKCHAMHHTLLNFSLMQSVGAMQLFKQNCDGDNFARFLHFLKEYYVNDNEAVLSRAVSQNKNILSHYLNQFKCEQKEDSIYNYCAKIYFLPIEGCLTGKMAEKVKEGIVFDSNKWNNLFASNKNLINDLLTLGKTSFDEEKYSIVFSDREIREYTLQERIVEYMRLAVRFWQAKGRYFELMDSIIDKKTAE